jgi:2-(1,2-epoxy-1,2-dihydrophenyl)acetyl-CoA isomerase
MSFSTLLLRREKHVLFITLNRPERMNSLNEAMYADLLTAFAGVEVDEDTRVVVLSGVGDAFCTGADLSGDEGGEKVLDVQPLESRRRRLSRGPQRVMATLYNLGVPTIAMVNGHAVGAGFDLALSCDLRTGCEHSRLAIGFTRLGLVPASGASWLLPRVVGFARASEIILGGGTVHPEEAFQMGLLNRLVPAAQLEEETMSLAGKIAAHPPVGVRMAKFNLRQGMKMDLEGALEMLAASQAVALDTDEHRTALAAWRQKRER